MQSFNRSSLFLDLKTREINGFRVRKRPSFGHLSSDSGGFGTGVLTIEHNGVTAPPLALSFCKTSGNCHFLAVSDEDGYVSLYDTRRKLPSLKSCRENAEKVRVSDWVAHHNAIFDICWSKDGDQILTASGDQTVKIWDVENKKCLGAMIGHTGSVKSLCPHPLNSDLIISGSRDGSFAIWDLRCKSASRTRRGDMCLTSIAIVNGAHISAQGKRAKQGKAANKSVTSVLYLKDEISIATAGAADSIVKFWDTRNLKGSFSQTRHLEPSTDKESGKHGISSLSQDSNGVFIAASCMDNRIYLHDVFRLDQGPVKTFSGSRIESFYVKSSISPDGTHILSGSSDGNAYIWQVKKPEASPLALKGHDGEVTAVDWCPSETGKMATSSDDFLVRIWNFGKVCNCSNTRSPSSLRRRVTASPSMNCRRLVMDEASITPSKPSNYHSPLEENSAVQHSPSQTKEIEIGTPESSKKRSYSVFSLKDSSDCQKTPDSALRSPSSVLNPPPSLKRKTIRDYFGAKS